MISWPPKDPNETLDYSWTPVLDAGDSAASFSHAQVSGTATVNSASTDDGSYVLWLSGGVSGETNVFVLTCTTAGGRTFEETAVIAIADSGTDATADFIAAFPAFAAVPAKSIAFWSDRARVMTGRFTDQLGDNAAYVTMLVTAHYLERAGQGVGAAAQAFAQGMDGFSEVRSGSLSLKRAEGASTSGGIWASTRYGVEAWPYLKGCVAGPLVTSTGSVIDQAFNGYAGPLPPHVL